MPKSVDTLFVPGALELLCRLHAGLTEEELRHEFPKLVVELLRVARMPECERLSGMSEDTLERTCPEYILKTSERTRGMRVFHALQLQMRPKS
jgi:hypothetical protein